jgi:hypothetical protein
MTILTNWESSDFFLQIEPENWNRKLKQKEKFSE